METPDSKYYRLVCEAELFGQAFFGWEATSEQSKKLEELWKEARS